MEASKLLEMNFDDTCFKHIDKKVVDSSLINTMKLSVDSKVQEIRCELKQSV